MTDSVLRCFDSHCHIIDPDYPLVENQGYLPEPFGVEDYTLAFETLPLTLCGGAIVSGSFQAFDTQYLVNALSRLGPNFVGVVNLRHDSTDDEIHSLHAQ